MLSGGGSYPPSVHKVHLPLCPPQVRFDIRVVQFHRVRAVVYCFFKFPKLQRQVPWIPVREGIPLSSVIISATERCKESWKSLTTANLEKAPRGFKLGHVFLDQNPKADHLREEWDKKWYVLITGKETNKDAFLLIRIRPSCIPPLPPTLRSPSIWVLFLQESTLLAVWIGSKHCASTETCSTAEIQLPQRPHRPVPSRAICLL